MIPNNRKTHARGDVQQFNKTYPRDDENSAPKHTLNEMIAVQQNKHPRGNENSSTRNLNGCGANGSVECRLIKKC